MCKGEAKLKCGYEIQYCDIKIKSFRPITEVIVGMDEIPEDPYVED